MDNITETAAISENIHELRVTPTEIRNFTDNFLQKTTEISEGKAITDAYPDENQRKLAEGTVPSFQEAVKKTIEDSEKFLPKHPISKLVWTITGYRMSDAALSLDGYNGAEDFILHLHTLEGDAPHKVTSDELKDVGTILGNLVATHALADRPLSEIKPYLGELGEKRLALSKSSKDRLFFLDTMIYQLRKSPNYK
jgi:hypothetical protein